jgi:beta-glucosidase
MPFSIPTNLPGRSSKLLQKNKLIAYLRNMKKIISILLLAATTIPGFAQKVSTPSPKISALLAKMSLEEKVGQMTQISLEAFLKTVNGNAIEPHKLDMAKLSEAIKKYKVGSILNVGGDAQTVANWQGIVTTIQEMALKERNRIPVLYGIDAIHGNNYTLNSVLFPQQIAQAASFNLAMVKKGAEISGYETRASFIPWTFSPVLDLGRQPVWPRIWETFGEDPYLVAEMGKATIAGFQGNNMADKYHVAACLKHYMGYSMPLSGHDRTPAWIPERELREYFLPQFAAAVKAGAQTVMVNSAEINGMPVHANHHILTDILKGELAFKGFVVSDWQDIQYLYQRHRIAKDNKEAVMMAINAGIDMSMVPTDFTFCEALVALVKEGKVKMSRIDDAVARILKVKMDVGLFDRPLGNAADYPDFNSLAHNQANYDITAETITLLKNTNQFLPLTKGKKILVAGPSANTMRSLNGGWARNWQGLNSNETEKDKNTILEAVQQVFGAANVSYSEGVSFEPGTDGIASAVSKAEIADVIVLCIGENSYTETPGNIGDLNLAANQLALATALAKTGKPIVLVLTEGRPRIIAQIEPMASAILHAYWSGNEGGNVIADVLAGKINPSGKLPYTYPRSTNSLINYYHKYTESLEFDPTAGYHPQWPFGFGLSYTTFKYSNLKLSTSTLTPTNKLTVSVDVTNTGNLTGKEAVLLYISDLVASVTPEVKRLRAFDKIELKAGETKTVSFSLDKNQLSFINHQLQRVTEPGDFMLNVGDLAVAFKYQ